MAQPGSPPRRSHRPRTQPPGWQADAFAPDDTDADLPPWAGPVARPGGGRHHTALDPYAGGYAGETRTALDDSDERPPRPAAPGPVGSRMAARRRGRAAATRLRKSRRKVYRRTAAGIVVCVIGALIAVLVTHHSPKPTPYVTTLLPGEFKSVPDACTSVSQAVLAQYLPGSSRTTTSQFSGATLSQCSFTIDAKPVFRLLEVSAQAYQPFAAASGDGSASENARDNFIVAKAALSQPPRKSPLSPAIITPLSKLGQQAFAAYQREQAGGIVSDLVTVVVLDRNVLITAELSAEESPGFGQTPTATLQAGATAAAGGVLAKLRTQPRA